MFKGGEGFQILFGMMANKVVRFVAHHRHQFIAFADDGFSLPPCQHSSKQAGDLDVLLLFKLSWNGDRIVLDKFRLIEFFNLFIEILL